MIEALRAPAGLDLEDVPPSDPWEAIRRGSRALSPRTGLLGRLTEGSYQHQDPVFFAAGTQPADISRFAGNGQPPKAGGGGEDGATALAAATGELMERYCAFFGDPADMVLGTHRELEPDAVSPDLLRLFSREQVARLGGARLEYFDDDARIRWVEGHSLTLDRRRLVPAGLVYIDHRPADDEVRVGLNASTGLAASTTLEEAILGGLLEVIERDAFTVAWLHRHIERRVEVDDPDLQAALRERLFADHPSVAVDVFDLTLDLPIPTLFLVMRRPSEVGPVVCVGSAARLSPGRALSKCMRESGQAFPYFRYLLDAERDWEPEEDFSNLTNFDYHCLTYLKRPELVPEAFSFCDRVKDRVRLSELPDRSTGRVLGDLLHCVERLRERGLEVIAVEITTPDVQEIGFRVVRVIVPGLVPLHGHHERPFLGVRRLFDLPHRLGWGRSSGGAGRDALNPFPHPFP